MGSFLSRLPLPRVMTRSPGHFIRSVLAIATLVLVIDLLALPRVASLGAKNPSTTAFIENRRDESRERQEKFSLHQKWVPLSRISPHLVRAVLVSEDGNFFSHHGFDVAEVWFSIREALADFSFPRGASTITQQLAKNLYLSESRNPIRKIRELVLTLKLEWALPKRRILELYLNVIEWGPGVFGAEAAAQYYFHTSAASLSPEQAARLAAIIPNPRVTYNPSLNPRAVTRRAALISKRMARFKVPPH